MAEKDTIVALASGTLPSAIAILRVSGSKCAKLLAAFVHKPPKARQLVQRRILEPESGKVIDVGMVVFMPGPNSYTGEDCLEFHLHGSHAVVHRMMDMLTSHGGVRMARAGEFSRRAFEAGKLDLTQVQGLSDLISAETESQRIQSLSRLNGQLGLKVLHWRECLVGISAEIEAQLDFSDEGDVVDIGLNSLHTVLGELLEDISMVLSSFQQGKIIREGFRIGLGGPPNCGKSSIINRLALSDVAIVTPEAGTTRDVREVSINICGQLVILYDSAGLRDTSNIAEVEGIRRARAMLQNADLIMWIMSADTAVETPPPEGIAEVLRVCNKSDLGLAGNHDFAVSCKTGAGFDALLGALEEKIALTGTDSENLLVSHLRDRENLAEAALLLEGASQLLNAENAEIQLELVAEKIRQAAHQLQRLLGLVDSEDVLDKLFSEFCIGK